MTAVRAIGLAGPFGLTMASLRAWVVSGCPSHAAPMTSMKEPWLPFHAGCEVPWDTKVARRALPDRKALKLMTRPVQIGLSAALDAWTPDPSDPPPPRRGMWVGTDTAVDEDWTFNEAIYAGIRDGLFSLPRFATAGHAVLNPLWLVKGLSNNVLAFAAKERDLQGPNDNLEAGEAGPLQALWAADHALREDRADRLLAGGVGSTATVDVLLSLARHRVPGSMGDDPDASRGPDAPFLPGEAAAFVQLDRDGDWGVLAAASGRVDAGWEQGPWAPGAAAKRLGELLAELDVQPEHLLLAPRLHRVAGELEYVRGRHLATELPIWQGLGDAGAGSGALLLPLARALEPDAPVALAAAGPGGEVECVVVGPR